MAARILRTLVILAGAAWTLAGLALVARGLEGLGTAILDDHLVVDSLLAGVGCTALAIAFSQVRFSLSHRGTAIDVSPDTAFYVLAALLLSPGQAALVGAVGMAGVLARRRQLPRILIGASGSALATGAAAMAVDAVAGGQVPGGRAVLLAALAAAAVHALLMVVGSALAAELRTVGGARSILAATPLRPLLVLETGLPVASAAMAGPFLDDPALALLVTIGAQGLAWTALRLLHESEERRRENEELRRRFGRYLPRQVASELMVGDEVAPGGEQREVTVMFVDVRGFTAWAEQVRPDDVLRILNKLLGDLAESVLSTEGTIDKFTGDGLMAVWNAPLDQPDHAARALRAVPRMLMRVRELNLRREAMGDPPLEVGIGLNTGSAMVGNVGHRDRLAYTAIGDAVNLAARIEQRTRLAGVPVLVGESTFLALPMQMKRQLMRLDSVEVKGRKSRVRLYAPIALARHLAAGDAAAPRQVG